jgi:hypothetical protein
MEKKDKAINEEKKWRSVFDLIKKTIYSSRKLSKLINKYLHEKDDLQKKAISEKIDFQLKNSRINKTDSSL